jgi:Kdo2-lipid IVA lauroyltransferase/acyltransferase
VTAAAGSILSPHAMHKPPKQRNDFLDRLVYFALRLVAMILHCFPVDANLRTAKILGSIVYAIDRKHRDRALANLRRSFPDLTESQREAIARQSVQHLLMFTVDMLFTTRLIRLDTWRKYVELRDFRRTLELLLQRDRGLILLTGHYGNWEILGYVLATLGFGTLSVARPLDNPYINDYVLGVRERQGQKIIGKRGATAEITTALARSQTVGFIADQNAGSKGVFVDFFGRKASTYKSIGLLAMEYQVPVVIGYARRLEDRFRFEVAAQDIIYPDDWRDQPDPLRYITQRYTRAIEDFVRADPSQYLWVHRRWKSRPKGEVAEPQD